MFKPGSDIDDTRFFYRAMPSGDTTASRTAKPSSAAAAAANAAEAAVETGTTTGSSRSGSRSSGKNRGQSKQASHDSTAERRLTKRSQEHLIVAGSSADLPVERLEAEPEALERAGGGRGEGAGSSSGASGEAEASALDEDSGEDTFYRLELVDPSSTAKPLRILLPVLPQPGQKSTSEAQAVATQQNVHSCSVTIGRDASQCDAAAVLRNDSDKASVFDISRVHCIVQWAPSPVNGWIVVDKSTKGCFVNGAKVDGQKLLQHGDILSLGRPSSAGSAAGPRKDHETGNIATFCYRFEKGSWARERAAAAAAVATIVEHQNLKKKKNNKAARQTRDSGSSRRSKSSASSRNSAEGDSAPAIPKLVRTFAKQLGKQFACPGCCAARMVDPVFLSCCGGAACRQCIAVRLEPRRSPRQRNRVKRLSSSLVSNSALVSEKLSPKSGRRKPGAAIADSDSPGTPQKRSRPGTSDSAVACKKGSISPSNSDLTVSCPACSGNLDKATVNLPAIKMLEVAMRLYDDTFKS